jgi:hypothetical protein
MITAHHRYPAALPNTRSLGRVGLAKAIQETEQEKGQRDNLIINKE